MACSFIRRASGEEDGSSSTRYRMEIESEWSLASNAWAIDSVVAGRYDADMASARKKPCNKILVNREKDLKLVAPTLQAIALRMQIIILYCIVAAIIP